METEPSQPQTENEQPTIVTEPSIPAVEMTPETAPVPTTATAPQPLVDPSSVPTAVVPPKKSRKGLLWVLISLLLIAIGLAGGWYLFGRSDTASKQTAATASLTTTKKATTVTESVATLTPEAVMAKIKTTVAASYTLVDVTNDTTTNIKAGQISYRLLTNSPAHKTNGYNFYNTYAGGSSIYFSSYYVSGAKLPTSAEAAIRTEIAKIYADFGMSQTGTSGNKDYSNLSNEFTGKGLICVIDDASNQTTGTTAACGLISAYADAAAAIKPFADAIPNLATSAVLNPAHVKNSAVDGYETATISSGDIEGIGGHLDLFYRKTAGSWKYFTGTQSELGCSAYNTTDLKNAYKGEACYDTSTDKDSTVQ